MNITKIFSASVLLILFVACNNQPQMESKFKTVTSDTTQFYPLKNYLISQIKTVDKSEDKISKVTITDGHKDSALITKETFDLLAKNFIEFNIADSSVKKFYTQNIFLDQTTNSNTFTYTTNNEDLPIQSAEVLLDAASNDVKRIFFTVMAHSGDSSITKKMGWKNNSSFFINSIIQQKDKKETVQQTTVSWN